MVSLRLSLYTGISIVMCGKFASTMALGAGFTAE